ncbi:GIY-YIG nuclease family protein [Pedobacter panaciterrae]
MKRKLKIGSIALPPKDSEAYKRMINDLQKREEQHPENKKEIEVRFNTAVKIWEAQTKNGSGMAMGEELRYYLHEYNKRTFNHGLRTMPTSYNVLEAFYNYSPKFNFFELLDEDNYLISFFDFIDYITSSDFDEKELNIEESFIDEVIYNFDISNKLDEITFSNNNGPEFVIGGISLVKRGKEVVILMLAGRKTDLSKQNKNSFEGEGRVTPGKEGIVSEPGSKMEAVPLLGKDGFWKTNVFCRFDLESKTIDARYIQEDWGNRFAVFTDDLNPFLDVKGNLRPNISEELIKKSLQGLDDFGCLFDLATKCLFLPSYFDKFEQKIVVEEHPTQLSKEKKIPMFRKEKLLPSKYKITIRDVYKLNDENRPSFDIVEFSDNEFKVERSGYWKNLEYDAKGKNKSGETIQGKTWVQKILTWFDDSETSLTVRVNEHQHFNSVNAGYIYLLRNASHDIDIFKIGLTKRSVETRAKELSSKTGVVDKFLTAEKWYVKDCILAESQIHEKLKVHRISGKREFFKISYTDALKTIQTVIDAINKE